MKLCRYYCTAVRNDPNAENLDDFCHKYLRYILKLMWSVRVSSNTIHSKPKNWVPIPNVIRYRRLTRFGYVLRQPDNTISKQCLKYYLLLSQWKQVFGQNKIRLFNMFSSIKSDLEPLGGFRKYSRHRDREWLSNVEPSGGEALLKLNMSPNLKCYDNPRACNVKEVKVSKYSQSKNSKSLRATIQFQILP